MHHRYWLLVAASVLISLGAGYASGSAAIGVMLLLLLAPLAILAVLYGAHAPVSVHTGIIGPRPPTGPGSDLIGQRATVIRHVEAGVWVLVAGAEWPARLPPFTPRPDPGATVIVDHAADGILVVRPGA